VADEEDLNDGFISKERKRRVNMEHVQIKKQLSFKRLA